jgi:hypothetical protein
MIGLPRRLRFAGTAGSSSSASSKRKRSSSPSGSAASSEGASSPSSGSKTWLQRVQRRLGWLWSRERGGIWYRVSHCGQVIVMARAAVAPRTVLGVRARGIAPRGAGPPPPPPPCRRDA